MSQQPYIIKEVVHIEYRYNPEYGDKRICECGHTYERHFDSYDDMEPVGCKYCSCGEFVEVLPGQKTGKDAEDDGYNDGYDCVEMRTEYENTKWQETYERWYQHGVAKRNSQEFKY